MTDDILNTLIALFDISSQLDILYKKEFGNALIDYTYTEMHCIDRIGKMPNPNVTKIASDLNLTKAAISKIIKKLIDKKAISSYKVSDNKKETYFKLTKKGRQVFDKHLVMHQKRYEKDAAFFEKFNDTDLKTAYKVVHEYTRMLQNRLDNIKENLK